MRCRTLNGVGGVLFSGAIEGTAKLREMYLILSCCQARREATTSLPGITL